MQQGRSFHKTSGLLENVMLLLPFLYILSYRVDKDKFKKGNKESFGYEFANPLTREFAEEKNKEKKK
ncbi:hypothetical protein [Desulfoscipio geothermicus]|nr:hypothetical protein [Desulfoscipio geothermicus]